MTHHYAISGAVLASEVPLAALAALESEDPTWASRTVRFEITSPVACASPVIGRVVHEASGVHADGMTVVEHDAGFSIRIHDHADFSFDRAGNAIVCTPLAGVALATIEQLLLDQVLPKVLDLRGQTCLHASTVVIDGAAVAFLGNSGSGKSTLAASFERTRPVLGDDCLAVVFELENVIAHASYLSLRLCRDAARAVFGVGEDEEAVSPRMSWKVRVPFARTSADSFPFRAAYVLDATPAEEVSVTPLGQRDGFIAYANYIHRLDPMNPARLERELATLSELSRRVPVSKLSYPRRFDALASARALVLADLERMRREVQGGGEDSVTRPRSSSV